MKVALVMFPISAEGGLSTRGMDTLRLIRDAGHDCNFYRIRYSDQMHMAGTRSPAIEVRKSGNRLQHRNLSITAKHLPGTVAHLSGYDLVVFLHPCPHLSDKAKAAANWTALYNEVRARKVVTFSDVYIDKYYPHFAQVTNYTPLGINSAVARHVSGFLKIPVETALRPVHLHASAGKWESRRGIVWPNAWRDWKGFAAFVRAMKDDGRDVTLYGSGRAGEKCARELVSFRNSGGRVIGQVAPAKVQAHLANARLAIDLTGASKKYEGHYNGSMIEAMLLGCPVGVRSNMWINSWIPKDAVMSLDTSSTSDLYESIRNASMSSRSERVARDAQTWARGHTNPARVLAQYGIE